MNESDGRCGFKRRMDLSVIWSITGLFTGMIAYKLATECGYYYILSVNKVTYPVDFNVWKYLNGWIWCIILFLGIRHEKNKASVFMLYLLYVSQVIPITCVYAMANDSALYYNIICFAILNAELILGWTGNNVCVKRKRDWSKCMVYSFLLVLLMLLFIIWMKNGMPTLIALNIYKVYELRGSGIFQINKYGRYLLDWMTGVIIPFLTAKYMDEKKYMAAGSLCLVTFVLYLYLGQKSILFSIPLVVACSLWMKRKETIRSMYSFFTAGFTLLVILALFSPVIKNLFFAVYQLIGRRVFLVPAVNKFKYFDFFSSHPPMGMAGIFPRWLIQIQNPYEAEGIGRIISDIYYNLPEMNSNTGFLAEGYMRFGYMGIFIEMCFFVIVLRLMDKMQKRTNLCLTVSGFVYPMLMLTDSHLIDSLILGKYTCMVVIMLVFRKAGNVRSGERKTKKEYKVGVYKKYCNFALRKYYRLRN